MNENVQRIEPTSLASMPAKLTDLVADLATEAERLSLALHPQTATNLAHLVRIMNAYYSNLIEGHNTRPRDIERALDGDLDDDAVRRNLQLEAVAHVRVQAGIDELASKHDLPEPASDRFILDLHRDFYANSPVEMRRVAGAGMSYEMIPGAWRSESFQDVAVGRLIPPASHNVAAFMAYFEEQFRFEGIGRASRIVAMAIAHHRLNYIHPFPDGNGRVSRLMSHAMGHWAGVGAHGLWSISRGLARGINDRSQYKAMMDAADAPRANDMDGRGNLSQAALIEFVIWFLSVAIDQVRFMTEQFDFKNLSQRLRRLVEIDGKFRPEAAELLIEALSRGEFARGEAARITGLPERSARRILADVTEAGLLASDSPKGPLSLRFPPDRAEILFPRLFAP